MFKIFKKARQPFSQSSSEKIREQYDCVSAYRSVFQLSDSLEGRQGIAPARIRGSIGLGASRKECKGVLGKPPQRIERVNPITDAIHVYRYQAGNYRYRDELHFSMEKLFYFARIYYFSSDSDLTSVLNSLAQQYLGCSELGGTLAKIVDPDGNDILVTANLPALHLQYLGRRLETIERLLTLIDANDEPDTDPSVGV
jgi:hypothetical protein